MRHLRVHKVKTHDWITVHVVSSNTWYNSFLQFDNLFVVFFSLDDFFDGGELPGAFKDVPHKDIEKLSVLGHFSELAWRAVTHWRVAKHWSIASLDELIELLHMVT